ncbi:hypothetical protein ABEB36_009223 [Hypothenemus hampei]|uniref:HTH psq-type domain-containing protein n=1 Tax=Hypothenemus hampei TaxID=57062 RepID=A0ABD1EQ58_HYPHA
MPKRSSYDSKSMECAIKDVNNNAVSLRAAAKKYGVPKSTLEFKLKNPDHKDTCGPSPILTLREESQLAKWIEELALRGFPRKKEDIINSVQKFLIENPKILVKLETFDALLIKEGLTDEFLALHRIWKFWKETGDSTRNAVNEIEKNTCECDHPESVETFNENVAEFHIVNESDKNLVPTETETPNSNKINVIQNIVINEADAVTVSSVSLSDSLILPSTSKSMNAYLNVPEKCERKSKRHIEPVPFAITSRLFQENFEAKRALKLEEKNKLERKKIREEKAAARSVSKNKQRTNSITESSVCIICKACENAPVIENHETRDNENEGNNCFQCKFLADEQSIICDTYEDDEDDLFLCHVCYVEKSEDETEEDIRSEEEKEKTEVEELLAIYKREIKKTRRRKSKKVNVYVYLEIVKKHYCHDQSNDSESVYEERSLSKPKNGQEQDNVVRE